MAHRFSAIGALALTLTAAPAAADAFCGFYISGAGGELYNNATQVVLMRQGTRTVLSMQNNYQGPPQDFAMVIPVPVVLQEHGHSPHAPHHDYQPVALPSPAWSVSSTTTSTSITPPTGRLSFGGHAPTIRIE